MDQKNEKYSVEPVKLRVNLIGKRVDTGIIISLDDLQSLVSGLNGLSKYVTKKYLGRDLKAKYAKEMKEICSLGLTDLKKGSAILEIEAFPCGQQKLAGYVNPENIMQETIKLIDNLEGDGKRVPLEVAPHLDNITKPLSIQGTRLNFGVYQKEKLLYKSHELDYSSRKIVQQILERKKLSGGVMYGTLKVINLKDYSAKVQLLNMQLERFLFEPGSWENIRDLLESKVEVRYEGKGNNKRLIDIKTVRSLQEKQQMTARDVMDSNIFGSLKNREDFVNSVEYSRKMADNLFK